ncbi:MAG TPA: SDR family NAD(P)-dependent oxidoreductase [Pyrinomonadaceae bacterium]|nr:SDR family NAD(P)-dependent oxidoreductase [Pyrinomonadaceae bacterium]
MGVGGIELGGRVALVTGGSRGIGRETVLELARAGARVGVNYLRDERGANEVALEAQSLGAEAIAMRADVQSLEESARLIETCVEKWGRLDVLVCNAGLWEGAAVEEMSEELWTRVLDINLKGTWAAVRAAVPVMKRQRSGSIIMVSSTAGQRGEPFYSNYAASKGGQIALTKALAGELGPYGIRVNAVAPGWVDTEMTAHVLGDESTRKSIEAEIPLGRVAEAVDIARPIVFLASDWARHMTGSVLSINGGSVL